LSTELIYIHIEIVIDTFFICLAGEKIKVNENPSTLSSMKENVDQVLHFMAVNKIRMHHTSSKG
jgi:hypothetical protein